MKRSRAAGTQTAVIILLAAIVILLPLGLTIAWGQHFTADSYTLFSYARNLAKGAGIIPNAEGSFPTPIVNNVIFGWLLSLPAIMGIEPSWMAWILSAVGWSAAALAILVIGRILGQSRGAIVTALLISFSPSIIATTGSPTSWIIALGWITVVSILRRRPVYAFLTGLLLIVLILPWPVSKIWWQLSQHLMVISYTIFLFVAGVGIDRLVTVLDRRDRLAVPASQITNWLLAAIFIILASWQATRLVQLFQDRPEQYWHLEEEVASWLQAETDLSSLILANSRVGYLSRRSTVTIPNLTSLERAAAIQRSLQAYPTDYVVTTNELIWQQLLDLNWFRLSYEPVEQFKESSLPEAPMTIWSYREPAIETGQRTAVNARVPDRLSILGYQIGPQQVQPGETVRMFLYLQAPETTALSPVPFRAIVRLVSPLDGRTVSDWEFDLPQSIRPSEWQAGEVIVEQLSLNIPADLEKGAYQFNLSLIGSDGPEMWPISLDKDINRLDRIFLGGIIVPGEDLTTNPQPMEATFAEAIELTGYTLNEPEPGKILEVNLYWETRRDIDEDYTVFLHLLDSDGALVASHDSQPSNGRFPTSSWLPGITIPDRHTIQLPDNLPAGEYELTTGLYDPMTGERLPAAMADDESPADNAASVTKIVLP